MFFKAPGNPTKIKKIVYFSLTIILGLLLSFLAHAFLEINYLRYALSQNLAVSFYGNCALPLILQIALLVFGAIGGFFLGRLWWRLIYVDRVWTKKYSSQK